MALDTLRLIRNVLLRGFALGIVAAIVMFAAMEAGWPVWSGLVTAWFHTDATAVNALTLQVFTEAKFFLIFAMLVPALALHWTIRTELARAK
jgi:uncharacterized membrane protein YeiB